MYEIPLRCPEKTRCWLEIRSACVEHEHSLLQHSHLHQWLILPGVKLGQRSTFSQTRQVRAHSFSPPSFHSFYPWLGLRMLWEHSPPSTLSTQVNLLCSGNIQRSSSDAEGGWGSGGERPSEGAGARLLLCSCTGLWNAVSRVHQRGLPGRNLLGPVRRAHPPCKITVRALPFPVSSANLFLAAMVMR